MRAAFFPESLRANPYLDLLEAALARHDVEVVPVGSDYLSGRWLWSQRGRVQVLHFHWLQHHYKKDGNRGSWGALAKFVLQLALARLLGYRVVWTMHNVLPHERIGRTDVAARRAMVALANSVIVLCEEGRRLLKARFGRRLRVYTTPHGSYIGVYADETSIGEARQALGLDPADRVFLFFGGIRAQKNVDGLIRAFSTLPLQNLKLMVVGMPFSDELAQEIKSLASDDPRISCHFAFVPDYEVQLYMAASDFVVLPFTDVLGSGSVILALGFGRPVVAPAAGCLPEMVPADAGFLYPPSDPDGLVAALRAASVAQVAPMQAAARRAAEGLSWDSAALRTIAAYTGAEDVKPPPQVAQS